jgi:DNA-binding transcriptional MerR regulator
MLTVTELARQSDTTPHAVRYYTRKGLLQPERHPENNYRLYKPSEVRWLKFVRQAKALGYTLTEIGDIKHDADQGQSPCPRVREILSKHIEANRKQLEDLMALQRRMEDALKQWKEMPDGLPDGHSVCHLIETIVEGDMIGED